MKTIFTFFGNCIRYLFKAVIIILIAANLYILITGNFYVYRAVYYTFLHGQTGPDILDRDYFFSREVANGEGQPWAVSSQFNHVKMTDDDRKKIESLQTTSFIIIRNDSLVYEEYFDGFDKEQTSNSFSMAKTVVGMLIGIAVKEKKIKSIDDKVGDYLNTYKEGFRSKLTIRHFLSMSSDMVWDESGWNPLSDNAEAYYGTNLTDKIKDVEYNGNPGKNFDYRSGNTQILAQILEKVTKKKLANYASEKIWKKIGAETRASWSLDHENGTEKAYCCLYATSRDYARLGKLVLHNGYWNGQEVVDSAFLAEATVPVKLGIPDGGDNDRYGLTFWCTKDENGNSIFYFRGIKGQYIVCWPKYNVVFVRTGHKRGDKRKDDQPTDLFDYLKAVKHILKIN